jgi:hypothetical protein
MAGEEGVVLTGLAAIPHTVEVMDPTLLAAPVTVSLREGETEEVEIDVRRR